jgi:hypothetical protein
MQTSTPAVGGIDMNNMNSRLATSQAAKDSKETNVNRCREGKDLQGHA